MNKKLFKVLNIILLILFVCSSAFLSTYLMIAKQTPKLIIGTVIITIICTIFLYLKTYKNLYKDIKNNKIFSIIMFLFSLMIAYKFYLLSKGQIDVINNLINCKTRYLCLVSLPSIIYLIELVSHLIRKWVISFYKHMDSFDKKAYLIASIFFLIVITIVYLLIPNFYLQYDRIYSIDSGWVFKKIIPDPHYYDIRHPLMSIFTFPFYAVISFIFPSKIEPILFQFVNVQLLIIIALELKQLTKKNIVFILYMISFSTLTLILFLEKYQLCVFLVVTYLYNQKVLKNNSNKMLISATSIMPTSGFATIFEFINKNSIKKNIINIFKIGIIGVLVIICLGRAHSLVHGLDELKFAKTKYASSELTIMEKINSTSKVFDTTFIGLPSKEKGIFYLWKDLSGSISILSIIILIIILIGIINFIRRKDLIYISFLAWLIFIPILFILLNWAPHETPLFTIYFSWVIIPMFIYGLEYIFKKLRLKRKVINCIYGLMVISILTINIYRFYDVFIYMLNLKI